MPPSVKELRPRRLAVHARAVVAEAQIQAAAARADLELARLARRPGRILVGPWLSEVGFEVLYWIPLLNWAARRYGIERERMVALTRGGAGEWYSDLCERAIDVFEFHSPEEIRAFHERRAAETRSLKQLSIHDYDEELIERARARLGGEQITVLHPSLMYNLLRAFWARRRPISFVERHAVFEPMPAVTVDEATARSIAALPEDYVAVKAYFSSCFPDNPANRQFVSDLLARLARQTNVVLLSTRIRVDDHADFEEEPECENVHSTHQLMTPRDNLAVQTRLIAGARALLTTYGGFSYLGPFYGVTSYSFHSHRNYNQTHLDVMARAVADLERAGRGGGFVSFSTGDAGLLESVLAGGGSAAPLPTARP